jgi:hypothetical protein
MHSLLTEPTRNRRELSWRRRDARLPVEPSQIVTLMRRGAMMRVAEASLKPSMRWRPRRTAGAKPLKSLQGPHLEATPRDTLASHPSLRAEPRPETHQHAKSTQYSQAARHPRRATDLTKVDAQQHVTLLRTEDQLHPLGHGHQ